MDNYVSLETQKKNVYNRSLLILFLKAVYINDFSSFFRLSDGYTICNHKQAHQEMIIGRDPESAGSEFFI